MHENSRLVEPCCAQVGQLSNLTAWKATVGNFFDSVSEVSYSPTSVQLVSALMMSCYREPDEFMCFHATVCTHPAARIGLPIIKKNSFYREDDSA